MPLSKIQTEVLRLLATLLFSMLAGAGCGDSLTMLNRLAAACTIHEDAPVTAHVQTQIAAPPATIWALLIEAPAWPKWNKQIESVTAPGPLRKGARFLWRTGGTKILSEVQLFEPERRLTSTGTALTAKAIHVWELRPESSGRTVVVVKESMDGPLMAQLFSSRKLAETDTEWLSALRKAAEH